MLTEIRIEIPETLKILTLTETEEENKKLLELDKEGYIFEITVSELDVEGKNYIYLVKNGSSQDAFYNVYISSEEFENLKKVAISWEEYEE